MQNVREKEREISRKPIWHSAGDQVIPLWPKSDNVPGEV